MIAAKTPNPISMTSVDIPNVVAIIAPVSSTACSTNGIKSHRSFFSRTLFITMTDHAIWQVIAKIRSIPPANIDSEETTEDG